jgi:hypothetical protein
VVDHETGRSEKKVQQKRGCTESNREDTQRKRKGVKTYGEMAQPRSHLLKERLMAYTALHSKAFAHHASDPTAAWKPHPPHSLSQSSSSSVSGLFAARRPICRLVPWFLAPGHMLLNLSFSQKSASTQQHEPKTTRHGFGCKRHCTCLHISSNTSAAFASILIYSPATDSQRCAAFHSCNWHMFSSWARPSHRHLHFPFDICSACRVLPTSGWTAGSRAWPILCRSGTGARPLSDTFKLAPPWSPGSKLLSLMCGLSARLSVWSPCASSA